MSGIIRIDIVSDWRRGRRGEVADSMVQPANELYRREFARIGLPLADGEETIKCTKEQAQARYDWQEGIDVILVTEDGQRFTLQEKCLTYFPKSTVTYEERKSSGQPGAWYYCTAQYYFVGYVRDWDNGNREFDDWVLLDNAAMHRAEIVWYGRQNQTDGRAAIFRYAYFADIPDRCIVSRDFRTERVERACIRHNGQKFYIDDDTPLEQFLQERQVAGACPEVTQVALQF